MTHLDIDRALRIQAVVAAAGWKDILFLADSIAIDAREQVLHILSTAPEKLTGRTAIKYASRAKAIEDFKDLVNDELKLLAPNPKGTG